MMSRWQDDIHASQHVIEMGVFFAVLGIGIRISMYMAPFEVTVMQLTRSMLFAGVICFVVGVAWFVLQPSATNEWGDPRP